MAEPTDKPKSVAKPDLWVAFTTANGELQVRRDFVLAVGFETPRTSVLTLAGGRQFAVKGTVAEVMKVIEGD